MILASVESRLSRVTSTSSAPRPLIVPAKTSSPAVFSTGSDSPVTGAWFTWLSPARTLLAMGAYGAMPKRFAHIHPTHKSPSTAIFAAGIGAGVFYTIMTILSEQVLTDTILSLGIMICFYYGLVAFGCIWFFRHMLFENAFNVVFKFLFPLLGGLVAGAGSALFGLSPDLNLALVGRTLVGLGVSVVFIAMLKLIALSFDERRFATMVGLSMLVGNLGSVLAGTPLAMIVEVTSWRGVFVGAAPCAVQSARRAAVDW